MSGTNLSKIPLMEKGKEEGKETEKS